MIVNKVFSQVESMKVESSSTSNELAISIQNSYLNFTKSVEKSYDRCFSNFTTLSLTSFLKDVEIFHLKFIADR